MVIFSHVIALIILTTKNLYQYHAVSYICVTSLSLVWLFVQTKGMTHTPAVFLTLHHHAFVRSGRVGFPANPHAAIPMNRVITKKPGDDNWKNIPLWLYQEISKYEIDELFLLSQGSLYSHVNVLHQKAVYYAWLPLTDSKTKRQTIKFPNPYDRG